MKTISIQIGNSDDKLSQIEWAMFVEQAERIISKHSTIIHFFGGSSNWLRWQNAAWVFECKEGNVPLLKEDFVALRKRYKQDAIGYLEGETVFL